VKRVVQVAVPDGLDDPGRPSGGNVYDRRVCCGLRDLGWTVHEVSQSRLEVLGPLPSGSVVLVDGLVAASTSAATLLEASRSELVVLLHLPLWDEPERRVLSAAAAVVVPSQSCRGELLERYPMLAQKVRVAVPGADRAGIAPGTDAGGELLCVAAVIPGKGHDVLLAALAELGERPWRLLCVGTLTRDPEYAGQLARRAEESGIGDRISFAGPLTGDRLAEAYAAADVLVLASRGESYGMVVTEALARGLPVIATEVGGVPEALGQVEGCRPGILVPPDDPSALAGALADWLDDGDLRGRLRRTARRRRLQLDGWATTADTVSRVLAEVTR
jgi:glycosyltransferase involved in cell wall biosynthesis